MKLNSSQLEAFYTAAKHGHFTKAADEINITQSALSQRIAKLEQDLEATLFIRDKKSLKLTEIGHQLLRYCQTSESLETEFLGNLKDKDQTLGGTLSFGCISSIGRSLLIPGLANLLKSNPNLKINIQNREVSELPRLLQSAAADYIITNQKSTRLEVENLLLGHEMNVLVQSRRFKNNGFFIDHDRDDTTTLQYFKENKMSFEPKGFHYLDEIYGLIDGVKNGLGRAVVPRHLIEKDKSLEIINPRKFLKIPIYLQFSKQPFYRTHHKSILETLDRYFKTALA